MDDASANTKEVSHDEFGPLRSQCDELLASEHVDKAIALAIQRLFHTAETTMLDLRHTKDHEIERLRHDLELARVTHRNADMLGSLASDVSQLKAQREEDARTSARLSEAIKTVEQMHGKKK